MPDNTVLTDERIQSLHTEESAPKVDAGLGHGHPYPAASGEAETVPFCDPEKQISVFRLERGKWAGPIWVAYLKCCENPLCDCANVDFYCRGFEGPKDAPMRYFSLDPVKRCVAPAEGRDRDCNGESLGKALIAEMDDSEWRELYQYLMGRKAKALREMDVTKLPPPPSPDVMTEDATLVRFADTFPFAQGFEFELGGDRWVADDQYCVMPDCDCREVVLSFLRLLVAPNGKTRVKQPVPAAGYDYKRRTVRAECRSAVGEPSLEQLVRTVRGAHPSLEEDAERRHNQLKTLYARAVLNAGPPEYPPGEPAVRSEPKIGRNDPCPCGSGKKYKKCCGSQT